jgi:glycosyltransferase involved in cell wall biosynthesis
VVSRLIPYKQVELAVQACTKMERKLIVAGRGSELDSLKKMAGSTVKFITDASDEQINDLYARAQAFIFTAEEDFGITPLEAMASGCPVIAYGKGGATETVVEGETGTFFADPKVESVIDAIKRFDGMSFDASKLRAHAQGFSDEVFRRNMQDFVERALESK